MIMPPVNWYFLFLIPVIVYFLIIKKQKASLKFSSVKLLKAGSLKKTIKHKIGRYIIAFSLIIMTVALARPQSTEDIAPLKEKGIDIAMVLDVSGSMQSVDIAPNRLEAARKTIDDFIEKRSGDRISLIIFAGTAYTRIPLTLDHNILRESLQNVSTESVNEEGTAIGMAVSVGINRLKKSTAKSKIIILVTDGDNNAGAINPATAAQIAKDMDIKIYSIGVGTDETILPVNVFGQTKYQRIEGGLNEKLLTEISESTEGKYYRAKDIKVLKQVFNEIDKLEKTSFDNENFKEYRELAFILIPIALLLLLIGIFFDSYYYIRIP
jgi:Ca-activated chloride channel family protein